MTDDLGGLLDAVEDALETSASAKIAEVGDAALDELLARFKDPVEAAKLPGTGLLNIAAAVVRIREKELASKAGQTTGPQLDEVDVILGSPLPAERKREQLQRVLDRIETRKTAILELLEGDLDEQR